MAASIQLILVVVIVDVVIVDVVIVIAWTARGEVEDVGDYCAFLAVAGGVETAARVALQRHRGVVSERQNGLLPNF